MGKTALRQILKTDHRFFELGDEILGILEALLLLHNHMFGSFSTELLISQLTAEFLDLAFRLANFLGQT